MTVRLKLGFRKLSDAALLVMAMHILESMNENGAFVNPVPTFQEMAAIVTAFSEALAISKKGDRANIADKNEKRKILEDALQQWGRYVLHESNNDRAKALTSGFPVVSERGVRPPLEKPIALEITNGINHGELICKGKRVAGAASYVFEFATLEGMTTNAWNRIASTKTKLQINNLTRGTLYYCRIGAVGTNGQLAYSTVTSHTAA